jgi:purine-nucleoside phosphorylase
MTDQVLRAVEALRPILPHQPRLGLILGSGLGGLVQAMEERVAVAFEDIPGFPLSTVEGHGGALVCGRLAGVELLALSGRVHYYEGYTMAQVTMPIRVMIGLGVERVIITNAAGAVNPDFSPGDIAVISDHINFMGDNPLRGGPNFVDLTQVYSRELGDLARKKAGELGLQLRTGVYTAFSGPCYETPAEIRAVRVWGGDLVGMSTVPEAIAARSLGVEVLGLSLVTNMAAGISGQELSHQEVIETSDRAGQKFRGLVSALVGTLGRGGRE